MNRNHRITAVTAALLLLGPLCAAALPPAEFTYNCFNVGGYGVPGSVAYDVSHSHGSASGVVTVSGGYTPMIDIQLDVQFDQGGSLRGSGGMSYYVRVVGPPRPSGVPLVIHARGSASATGYSAMARGDVRIDGLILGGVAASTFSNIGPPEFQRSLVMMFTPDWVVRVQLSATAEVFQSAQAQIIVDPSFEIDPSFPDRHLYRIEYSANLMALRGDLNCDGRFDNFDIDPFVLALVDQPGWQTLYPGCPALNGDINDDQSLDLFDIDPFIGCIVDSGCSQ